MENKNKCCENNCCEENNNCCCKGHWGMKSHFGDKKGCIKKAFVLLLVITSVFMIFKTIGAYKTNQVIGKDVIGRTIILSGEGEVFAVADIATFSFSSVEEAKTPSEAQNMSAEKVNKAIDYLKENGVEEKDIKTTNYNLNPRYEWRDEQIRCVTVPCPPSGNKRVLIGYEVNQTIAVKVRNTEKAGTILAGIGGFGLSNISGLDFSIDDEEELQKEARKLAIDDARNKAEELARDLGVRIVRVVNFNESKVYPYAGARYGIADFAVSSKESITPQIPTGENRITSNVNITYEIK